MGTVNKQEYPRASNAVIYGGYIMFVGGIFLMISFLSPYWFASYEETHREFKNMGIWQYCFDGFRFPNFQFDKKFEGCHNVYSEEYHVIREWLVPPWLLIIQIFMTLSLLLSLFGQASIALIVIRLPLKFILRYEWIISSAVTCCSAIAGFLIFVCVILFPFQCWDREWLMYPTMNHLSGSYYFAIAAMILHSVAALFVYLDARQGNKMRKESRNLVVQMRTNSRNNQGSIQRMGYI